MGKSILKPNKIQIPRFYWLFTYKVQIWILFHSCRILRWSNPLIVGIPGFCKIHLSLKQVATVGNGRILPSKKMEIPSILEIPEWIPNNSWKREHGLCPYLHLWTHSNQNCRDFETWPGIPGPPGVNCIWTSFNTSKTQSAASSRKTRGFPGGFLKPQSYGSKPRGPSEPSSSMKESTTQLRPGRPVSSSPNACFLILVVISMY